MEEKIELIIDLALKEDLGEIGDITSNYTIPKDKIINFQISNRDEIILCGVDVALRVFDKVSKDINVEKKFKDGDFLEKDSVIISGKGNARDIFAAERIALNLIQHLSGIATNTSKFVSQIEGNTRILDTRKTIPGLRELQKYGVKTGGGKNHRMALCDGILIKDNHIAAAGSIRNAVLMVRDNLKESLPIEIECDNLSQVKESLEVNADIIMLDNMNLGQIKEAVKVIEGKAKIEVSGNITLDRVNEISKAGVDYISVGALTHSVKAVDIGLDIIS